MMLKYTLSTTAQTITDRGSGQISAPGIPASLGEPWPIRTMTSDRTIRTPGGRAHQFMKLDYYPYYLQTLSIIEWIFWPEGQIRGSGCCLDQRVCRNRFPTGHAILTKCVLTIWLKDLTSVAPMTLCCTMLRLIASWLSLLTLVRN